MRALYSLIIILAIFASPTWVNAQCSNCTRTVNSSSGSLDVYSGDVICIAAGVTFTGSISMHGGTLCNNGKITGNVNFYSGKIYNNPGATYNAGWLQYSGEFHNYGEVVLTGGLHTYNPTGAFYNYTGAKLTAGQTIENGHVFVNNGTVKAGGEYRSNSNSLTNINNGTMEIGGLKVDKTFDNNGPLKVNGNVTVNNTGTLTNAQGITITATGNYSGNGGNASTVNNGTIEIGLNFVNSGNFTNNFSMKVLGNFTNTGSINGDVISCNGFWVGGSQVIQWANGSISNNDFCAPGTTGNFTTNHGNVSNNVTYCSCNPNNNNPISPLPIVLKSFTADCNGNAVAIDWVTSTEINNAFFTISRSADAITWETLQVVEGAMNSNQDVNYSIKDLRPLDGISYYRLHQTDLDGTSEYFNPISASCSASSDVASVSVYPNPADEQFTVAIQAVVTDSKGTVEIYDLTGRKQLTKLVSLQEGTNSVVIERAALASGTYTVRVVSNGNILGVQKTILR